MSENNQSKKPVFLYVVIAVLTIAVIGLGALSFLSLSHLVSLQQKVQTLSDTVEDISTTSNTLISQADQLNQLKEQEAAQQASAAQNSADESESSDTSQEEGTLSPSNNTTFTDNTDSSMDALLNQVQTLLPQDNGTWSVYVCNLLKDSDGTVNDTPMQAASLIKLFIMGAVYENYDSLSQQYGSATLDSYLTPMITVSDNDAANSLVSCLGSGDSTAGMQKVNSFCQSHGYTNTSMGRLLLASNEFGDNYTSAYDCGKFLKEIYQICSGTTQTPSLLHAEEMYSLLKQQQRTNKIPAALPEGVSVANKTGELSDVENDAGILYNAQGGNDLVIVFLSQNLSSPGEAQNTIAQLSRSIYLYYND